MSESRLDTLADLVLAEQGFDEPLELLAMAPMLATQHGEDLRALRDTASLATAAMLAPAVPPLPDRLHKALEGDALAHCIQLGAVRLQDLAARSRPAALAPSPHQPLLRLFAMTALVAAAGLLLLLTLQRGSSLAPPVAREQLLSSSTANVRFDWTPGPSPLSGRVRGDVVWSDDRQEGYLRFSGLPPLDEQRQFQLWIVDESRQGAPVDGGLFDLPAGASEAVVPVQAKLPVQHARAFVVTVEARGGVVVSEQKDVVAVAGL